MAKIYFSGFHTGNTVKTLEARTVGDVITRESLDMSGATIVLSRNGSERKITDYDTTLIDGDVMSVQKSSVKSGGSCTSREVHPEPPKPKEDIPRLSKDNYGNIVLVNRDVWEAGRPIFSGTIVLGKTLELGYTGNFMKSAFQPFYGKVEIEYKR